MSESVIGSLVFDGTTLTFVALDGTHIKNVVLQSCKKVESIGFYKAQIEQLNADDCILNNFRRPNASIGSLYNKNSQLLNNDFEELHATEMTLENVSLSNKVDFTNAHINQLTIRNIKKAPGLKLITIGSNVKLE